MRGRWRQLQGALRRRADEALADECNYKMKVGHGGTRRLRSSRRGGRFMMGVRPRSAVHRGKGLAIDLVEQPLTDLQFGLGSGRVLACKTVRRRGSLPRFARDSHGDER